MYFSSPVKWQRAYEIKKKHLFRTEINISTSSPLRCETHVQIYTRIEQIHHDYHIQLLDTLISVF